MAWSWSHTADAYQNARDNLSALSDEDLITIFAEWKACDVANKISRLEKAAADWDGVDEEMTIAQLLATVEVDDFDSDNFNEDAYERAKIEATELIAKGIDICDFIYERAEQEATCDNGGFNAWMCPSGCHTVSFSPSEELISKTIIESYPGEQCPDCKLEIPEDVADGDECANCDHTFTLPKDND